MSSKQQSTKTLDISRFDINSLPPYGFNVITARRGQGKTTLAFHIARSRKDAFTGIAMACCGSMKTSEDYRAIIHPMFIFEPSLEFLQRLIDQQNKLVKQYGKDNFPDTLKIRIYFDDVGTIAWFIRSAQMKYLASNGRHLFIDITIMVQYLYQLTCEVREAVDLLFVLKTGNSKVIKIIHTELLTCTDQRTVTALLLKLTQDRGCMVVSNCSEGSSPSEMCFYLKIKATDPDDTRLVGDPKLIEWAIEHSRETFAANVARAEAENREIQENDEDNEGSENNVIELSDLVNELQMDDPFKHAFSDKFGRIIVRQKKDKFD